MGLTLSSGSSTLLKRSSIAAVLVLILIWSFFAWKIQISEEVVQVPKLPEHVDPTELGYYPGAVKLGEELATVNDADTGTPGNPFAANSEPTRNNVTRLPAPPSTRPLILYAYSESDAGKINLEYFIEHGLHSAADFIFILNGATSVEGKIPKGSHIRVAKRKNECYDLGAHAEILLKNNLYKAYSMFILMNASIRGPFMPSWSGSCWSDMYLSKLNRETKLVGLSANCWPTFHVQSMLWATDIVGLETLLFPPKHAVEHLSSHPLKLPDPRPDVPIPEIRPEDQAPGINGCFKTWDNAVAAEIGATALMRAAGYKVDAMVAAFHGEDDMEQGVTCEKNKDLFLDNEYYGINIHPFETVFFKSNRAFANANDLMLEKHTKWMKGRKYSSEDYCHGP